MVITGELICRCLVALLMFRILVPTSGRILDNANLVSMDIGSSPMLSATDNRQPQRNTAQMHSDVSASSTAAGTHSASGNLTTAASYRAGPNAAGIGVALIDGSAAADNGTASVSAKGPSAPMASAASTAGLSNGTGRNASASQGLTAVTTTANSTANSDIIHNSAAAGSSAADLSSSSAAQSQTGSSKDRHSSNSSTGGDVSATGPGKAANVVSDSSEVSTTATPDKVTASQATNATANQASKYIAADITADQTAFDHGHATVSSGTSGDKVAGSVQGAGTEHAEVAFTG
ncbi:TPA: hypothetical protein ACH3X3_008919 [Trebouxia sp. C0006]